MLLWDGKSLRATFLAGAALLAVACGDTTKIPEAQTTGPLTASPVHISQTGDVPARIQASSVTFQLDDSGTLVVRLSITSTADASQTLAVHASLADTRGAPVGDASGGVINVSPGATTSVELNGPAPTGTIASAVFEVVAATSPTPTAAST